jgi:hypothetical protein
MEIQEMPKFNFADPIIVVLKNNKFLMGSFQGISNGRKLLLLNPFDGVLTAVELEEIIRTHLSIHRITLSGQQYSLKIQKRQVTSNGHSVTLTEFALYDDNPGPIVTIFQDGNSWADDPGIDNGDEKLIKELKEKINSDRMTYL